MNNENNIEEKSEIELTKTLKERSILPGPLKCICNSTVFPIQKDASNKTSGIFLDCTNYKYRKKYPIRINQLSSLFPFQKLGDIYEIILCFLCYEFKVEKALTYLANSKNIKISKSTLLHIYQKLRDIIYKYMNIVYDTELINNINKNGIFLVYENLINHNNRQMWLLGIIKNRNIQFRLVGSLSRESTTLRNFTEKFIFRGNTIVTDHWQGYNWLDSKNS